MGDFMLQSIQLRERERSARADQMVEEFASLIDADVRAHHPRARIKWTDQRYDARIKSASFVGNIWCEHDRDCGLVGNHSGRADW